MVGSPISKAIHGDVFRPASCELHQEQFFISAPLLFCSFSALQGRFIGPLSRHSAVLMRFKLGLLRVIIQPNMAAAP